MPAPLHSLQEYLSRLTTYVRAWGFVHSPSPVMFASTFALALDALISSAAMHTNTFSPTLEALAFLFPVLADAAADAVAAGPNLPAVHARHKQSDRKGEGDAAEAAEAAIEAKAA